MRRLEPVTKVLPAAVTGGARSRFVPVYRGSERGEQSRAQLLWIALLACIPLPLLSVTALAFPVPGAVDRAAARLIPFVAPTLESRHAVVVPGLRERRNAPRVHRTAATGAEPTAHVGTVTSSASPSQRTAATQTSPKPSRAVSTSTASGSRGAEAQTATTSDPTTASADAGPDTTAAAGAASATTSTSSDSGSGNGKGNGKGTGNSVPSGHDDAHAQPGQNDNPRTTKSKRDHETGNEHG